MVIFNNYISIVIDKGDLSSKLFNNFTLIIDLDIFLTIKFIFLEETVIAIVVFVAYRLFICKASDMFGLIVIQAMKKVSFFN